MVLEIGVKMVPGRLESLLVLSRERTPRKLVRHQVARHEFMKDQIVAKRAEWLTFGGNLAVEKMNGRQ